MRNSSSCRLCEPSVINCKTRSERCLDLIDLPPLLRSFLRKSLIYHGHDLIKQLTVAILLAKLDAGNRFPY